MNHSEEDSPTKVAPRLRKAIPKGIWHQGSRMYWWWRNRGNHQLAAALSARWRRNKEQLLAYRDRHAGERCFVIGNGPSLRNTDLSLLEHEITFGMNRVYLMFEELGFPTTYFVAINTLVIEQCAGDIRSLAIPRFLTWRGRRWVADDAEILFIDTDYSDPETFSTNLNGRVFEGGTVTYVALQAAYWMGFREVILVGVDHSYTTEGPANATVVSRGDDPDHFDPGYFGPGFRWQLPDLEASERAYRMAREAFEVDGRRIVDATIGGKLTVFPKVDYDSLFD
ncbi:MAG: 6-hydroxymethylpterin diphosphokinase MptE-like protein [Anaerolineales bacterium]